MGIEDSYSEPHRHYHTGAHIEHCLRQFDRARDSMEDANAIELALWFHDVEYDPQSPNNEQESAERFRRSATGMMSDDLVEQVYRLIMATIHDYAPQVPDEQYVVDIDLSSFGLPWNEFVIDSRKVSKKGVSGNGRSGVCAKKHRIPADAFGQAERVLHGVFQGTIGGTGEGQHAKTDRTIAKFLQLTNR